MLSREDQSTNAEQPTNQRFFQSYSDGFGINYGGWSPTWRLSNVLPNLKALPKTALTLAVGAASLLGKAQAISCGRYDTIVTANDYFKDANGTNYRFHRIGCNYANGDGWVSLSDLDKQCGTNSTFPITDIAANYVNVAHYYYDTLQLDIGEGEASNRTVVECAMAYLANLESTWFAITQAEIDRRNAQQALNSEYTGIFFAALAGAILSGVGIYCAVKQCRSCYCQPCKCCESKDPQIHHTSYDIEANAPQTQEMASVQESDIMEEKPATEKSDAENLASSYSTSKTSQSAPGLFKPREKSSSANSSNSSHIHEEEKKSSKSL